MKTNDSSRKRRRALLAVAALASLVLGLLFLSTPPKAPTRAKLAPPGQSATSGNDEPKQQPASFVAEAPPAGRQPEHTAAGDHGADPSERGDRTSPSATVVAPEATPADARSDRTCTYSGTATVAGDPSAVVYLHLRQEEDWQTLDSWTSTAAADGTFGFDDLRPGWYALTATSTDAVPLTARSWLCTPRGERASVDLILRLGTRTITGRVVGENEDPLADARVTVVLVNTPADFLAGAAAIELSPQASFRFAVLPGPTYRIYATHPEYLFGSVDVPVDASKDHYDVVIALEPDRRPTVSGTVVHPDGQPAGGATVYRGPEGITQGIGRVTADDRGQFTIAVAPDRPYVITAISGGLLGYQRYTPLNAGESHLGARIELAPARSVESVLVDRDGNGIPFARVIWSEDSLGLFGSVMTDYTGSFFIPAVPVDREIALTLPPGTSIPSIPDASALSSVTGGNERHP